MELRFGPNDRPTTLPFHPQSRFGLAGICLSTRRAGLGVKRPPHKRGQLFYLRSYRQVGFDSPHIIKFCKIFFERVALFFTFFINVFILMLVGNK